MKVNDPRFKYKMKVKVMHGFYEGRVGTVICDYETGNYAIELDDDEGGGYKVIDGECLEEIRDANV